MSSPAARRCASNSTGLPPATLSLYLPLLLRDGLADHDADRKYSLAEPGTVAARLARYRARFPDLLAESAREIFEEAL